MTNSAEFRLTVDVGGTIVTPSRGLPRSANASFDRVPDNGFI